MELPLDAAPLDSIVLCAQCCTALSWDGAYRVLTAAQIARLPPIDRTRMLALAAAQRARLQLRRQSN